MKSMIYKQRWSETVLICQIGQLHLFVTLFLAQRGLRAVLSRLERTDYIVKCEQVPKCVQEVGLNVRSVVATFLENLKLFLRNRSWESCR
jgi:hypothetical protein